MWKLLAGRISHKTLKCSGRLSGWFKQISTLHYKKIPQICNEGFSIIKWLSNLSIRRLRYDLDVTDLIFQLASAVNQMSIQGFTIVVGPFLINNDFITGTLIEFNIISIHV
jgi:hypothetical protein